MLKNKRLLKIIENFPPCAVAADIGCDHGKLAVEIIKRGLAQKVIASDISEKSLEKAKNAAERSLCSGFIECVHADGLDSVKDKNVDNIVLAGMGGMLIADIIEGGKDAASSAYLCLCPHTNEAYLRQYLCENGFGIIKEIFVKEDGKFYQLIFAKKGKKCSYKQEDLEFGFENSIEKNSDYFEFLEYRMSGLKREISAMQKGGADAGDIAAKEKLLAFAKRRVEWRSI